VAATLVRGDGRWQGNGVDRPVLRALLHCASLALPDTTPGAAAAAGASGKGKGLIVSAPLPSDMASSSSRAKAAYSTNNQKSDLGHIIANAAALRNDLRASAAAAARDEGRTEPASMAGIKAAYPTTCFRELHGAADGLPPNFEVDR